MKKGVQNRSKICIPEHPKGSENDKTVEIRKNIKNKRFLMFFNILIIFNILTLFLNFNIPDIQIIHFRLHGYL